MRGRGCTFGRRHLALVERWCVVAAGVEVNKLIDAIEHLSNKLAQVETWRDADATAELSGNATREVGDVLVVDSGSDPGRVARLLRKQVTDAAANSGEGVKIEARQANLNSPW